MFEENSKKSKGLTAEKLKQYKGLEDLTDEQAKELVESLNQYASIIIRAKPFEQMKVEVKKRRNRF